MIAFSSNFIPRLVYIIVVSGTNDDIGFLDHSLAYFDTADFQTRSAPISSIFSNVTVSFYFKAFLLKVFQQLKKNFIADLPISWV